MRRIFICYNVDRDRLLVERLQEVIQEQFGWDIVGVTRDKGDDEQFSRLRSLIQRSSLTISIFTGQSANVLLETGIALGLGKQTLVAAKGSELLPTALASLPYLALSGDPEIDVPVLIRRIESFQVEEERPSRMYSSTTEQLRSYFDDSIYFESLSPLEFEELIAHLFQERGFTIDRSSTPHDVGIDLVITRPLDGETVAIQVKKSSRQSRVSMRDVMALLGAATLIKADSAALITSSSFTRASLEMAAATRSPKLHLLTVEDLLLRNTDKLFQ